MNQFPYDVNHAIANDKLNRYRSEADSHRLAKAGRSQRPGAVESLIVAVGQGLASLGESFKRRENKPTLPAV